VHQTRLRDGRVVTWKGKDDAPLREAMKASPGYGEPAKPKRKKRRVSVRVFLGEVRQAWGSATSAKAEVGRGPPRSWGRSSTCRLQVVVQLQPRVLEEHADEERTDHHHRRNLLDWSPWLSRSSARRSFGDSLTSYSS
jgi:hypothetical protein